VPVSRRAGPAADSVELHPAWIGGLDDYVTALRCSPDGQAVAATSASGKVGMWSVEDGAPLSGLGAHQGDATSLAWSPDSRNFATGGHDSAVRLWSRESGRELRVLPLFGWVDHLAWHPTSGLLAAAAGRGVEVWGGRDFGTVARWSAMPSTVSGLRWLRAPDRLVAACYGGVFRFCVGVEQPDHHFRYPGAPLALAVAPDESWLVSGNLDASVHLWPMRGARFGREDAQLGMHGFDAKVEHVGFDHSFRWLYNTAGPMIARWPMPDPAGRKGEPLAEHPGWVTALAPQPSGTLLASADDAGMLCLWRSGGKLDPLRSVRVTQTGVTALAWSPDGALLSAGTREGLIQTWRVADARASPPRCGKT